jgi:hypothetical protein
MNDRVMIPADHQEDYDMMSDARRQKTKRARSGRRHRTGEAKAGLKFTAQSVVHRLINTVAPRYLDRPGGYTRIIRLARTRIGDNSDRAVLQLVGEEEAPGPVSRPKKTAREKRVERRYAATARAVKGATKRSAASTPPTRAGAEDAPETPAEPEPRSPESEEPFESAGGDQAPKEG